MRSTPASRAGRGRPFDRQPTRIAQLAALALVALTGACAGLDGTEELPFGTDTSNDANVGIGDGVEPCPINARCPCLEDEECESGICFDGPDGKKCLVPCEYVCIEDEECVQLSEALTPTNEPGIDGNAWCVPEDAICKPTTESCNGEDDDCDGVIDENATNEVCNGEDDDCDGQVDEGMDAFCDDNEQCTEDSCAGGAGCLNQPVIAPCDDGDLCTVGDACLDGACETGEPVDCDDGNVCTTGACDPLTGACDVQPAGGPCDDGTACTAGDTCVTGACQPGPALDCDDANPCTDDSCDAATGCVNVANSLACDDGDPCTDEDACAEGACVSGAPLDCSDDNVCTTDTCDKALIEAGLASPCTSTVNEVFCDDGDPCTAGDGCVDGACVPGGPKECDDGNPCTTDSCEPVSGECQHAAAQAGTPCDDDVPCTVDDTCQDDGSCIGPLKECADDNFCTEDSCAPNTGECLNQDASGKACQDGNGCTLGDACELGACAPGAPKICDDGNPCTDDSCDEASGECIFAANSAPCSDGDACTSGDVCVASQCTKGAMKDCNDGDICTVDSCNADTGECATLPNADGVACDDGVKCTVGDECVGGSCVAGAPLVCDDGNPCTADACDPATGICAYVNTQDPCDDGNKCTVGDVCESGQCIPGANECECEATADCAAKEDGNLCNGTLECDLTTNTCVIDVKTVIVCDTSKNTTCAKWVCDPAFGTCGVDKVADGTACDADDSVCTVNDACLAGVCAQGKEQVCDDNNPCTVDSCDPKFGCIAKPNALPCDDGDACTQIDVCADGACTGTLPVECEDNDDCTADSCDTKTGSCLYTALSGNACDDGNACSTDELCVDGGCVANTFTTCNDDNQCTTDKCNVVTGQCEFTPYADGLLCEDGDLCTLKDQCIQGSCASGSTLKKCVDGTSCTSNECDPATGDCFFPPKKEGDACDDGDGCTLSDKCMGGVCTPDTTKQCDDNNVCTADSCDKQTGQCVFAPVANGTACNDGNACSNVDKCNSNGVCKGSSWTTCNDGNPCTDNKCNKNTGACYYPQDNNNGCSDNNACTVDDSCKNGVCTPLFNLDCDDGEACTTEYCDPKQGCVFANVADGTQCFDDDICTVNEQCQGGKCTGDGVVCDDGNPCTDDSCDPVAGCTFSNNDAICDDGNACTEFDQCADGKCQLLKKKNCSDGNQCTDDSCDPATGCAHVVDDTNNCSDDNKCTAGDACQNGQCKTTGPVVCDDNNDCTVDSCKWWKGCEFVNNDANPCDDGNACTGPDVCIKGGCFPGKNVSCNDGNVCTDDSCDVQTGCVNADNNALCDDGDACAGPDLCANGACGAGAPITCDDSNVCTTDSCDPAVGCVHEAATGSSQASLALASDPQTSASDLYLFDLEKGIENDGAKAAALTYDGHPDWTATIPNAKWLWSDPLVTSPTDQQCRLFHREITVPGSATNLAGTLKVAHDGTALCAMNGVMTVDHPSADPLFSSTVTEVDISAMLQVGPNHLHCEICNIPNGEVTPEGNPAGLLYGVDITFDVNAITCNDGNACTALDICQGGICTGTNGLDCNDSDGCTVDSCDPLVGCSNLPADNVACDDDNVCTTGEVCTAGMCGGGAPTTCDDGNSCTDDGCSDKLGCLATPKFTPGLQTISIGSSKDTLSTDKLFEIDPDGNPNNANIDFAKLDPAVEIATNSAWKANISGSKWIWPSSNPDPKDIAEGLFVEPFVVPAGAVSIAATLQVAVDDMGLCLLNGQLVGQIDAADKTHVNPAVLDVTFAIQEGGNTLVCGVRRFPKANGTPQNNPAGIRFRLDVGFDATGQAPTCSDGNVCTEGDTCAEGVCSVGKPKVCDDGNSCTIDACDAVDGCLYTALNDGDGCTDGDICTVDDACSGGTCVGTPDAPCDDGNECTADTCDPNQGCLAPPVADGTGCDDGDICTVDESCQQGACAPAGFNTCDDGSDCTNDVCYAASGCVHTPNEGGACNDGNQCTGGDKCSGGKCLGVDASGACNDGSPCTIDACDPVGGCVYQNATGPVCDDGDLCSQTDKCQNGTCVGGDYKLCSDGEVCTADGCDGQTGNCSFDPLNDGACDDGNFCTLEDFCLDGLCEAGELRPCGDGNPCTADNCNPETGNCFHDQALDGTACSDGNLCTVDDECINGKCISSPKACDDDNACTADSCDPQVGVCTYDTLPDGTSCDDEGGLCKAGVCE